MKTDTRILFDITDSELDDLLYDYAVTQHGHASVKRYCNDLSLWGSTVDEALRIYREEDGE